MDWIGTTLEGSIRARAMLTEEGKKVGFKFNYFDEMKMLNTHQCHQLLHWAKESDFQNQLAEAYNNLIIDMNYSLANHILLCFILCCINS